MNQSVELDPIASSTVLVFPVVIVMIRNSTDGGGNGGGFVATHCSSLVNVVVPLILVLGLCRLVNTCGIVGGSIVAVGCLLKRF